MVLKSHLSMEILKIWGRNKAVDGYSRQLSRSDKLVVAYRLPALFSSEYFPHSWAYLGCRCSTGSGSNFSNGWIQVAQLVMIYLSCLKQPRHSRHTLKPWGQEINTYRIQRLGPSVKLLGVLLGRTQVMLAVVIDKIQAFPIPKTVKELQALVGLLGYWRPFIQF